MTSRFFIANRENKVESSRPIVAQVAPVKPIIFNGLTKVTRES